MSRRFPIVVELSPEDVGIISYALGWWANTQQLAVGRSASKLSTANEIMRKINAANDASNAAEAAAERLEKDEP